MKKEGWKMIMNTVSAVVHADEMLENKGLREKLIDRLDVLEKVKTLLLIPELEMMTMKQVADYFEVDPKTIGRCWNRNRSEIEADGAKSFTGKGLLLRHDVAVVEKQKGCYVFEDGCGNRFEVSNAPTTFFSKRAILRIGMLLRDSTVAQEVRTQLLNIFEQSDTNQRQAHVDKEKQLLYAVIDADEDGIRAVALGEYRDYMRRNQRALETQNEELSRQNKRLDAENDAYARDVMLWSDRAILQKLMCIYSGKTYWGTTFQEKAKPGWKRFYDELYARFRISLALRRKYDNGAKGKLDYLLPEEWPIAVRVAYSMCRNQGYDILGELKNDVVFERILACEAMDVPDRVKENIAAAGG